MEGKIERAVLINKMADAYKSVIIGFSGGADSSALLHYFAKRAKKVACVHVNHMIRGAEAERDEEFCRSICEKYGVELICHKIDIPALAKKEGRGIEEIARQERYRVFYEELEARGFDAILTAHNADDNTESIIFNLARGSGTNGIAGIKPVNGKILRPLILATRQEIIAYCEKNGIEYVTDSTNADTDYTRNYIRHEIVPALNKLNPSLNSATARLSEAVRMDEELLSRMAHDFVYEHCADGRLRYESFEKCHPSIMMRVLKILSKENLDYKAITSCLDFIPRSKSGEVINLCKGISLKREHNYLVFIKTKELERTEFSQELLPGLNEIKEIGVTVAYMSDLAPENKSLYCTINLRADAIKGSLLARSRKEGDTIRQGKMTKKVKKLMCEAKIPSHLRNQMPIFCDELGIVAIPSIALRDGASGKDIALRLYK